jgi:hypothetical protein
VGCFALRLIHYERAIKRSRLRFSGHTQIRRKNAFHKLD